MAERFGYPRRGFEGYLGNVGLDEMSVLSQEPDSADGRKLLTFFYVDRRRHAARIHYP